MENIIIRLAYRIVS